MPGDPLLILPVFFLGSSKTGLRTTLEQDKDTSLLEKKAALKAIDELKAGNLEAGKAATKAAAAAAKTLGTEIASAVKNSTSDNLHSECV